jgi:hypothetical protein
MGSYRVGSGVLTPAVATVVDTGHVLFSELSWTPPWTHDLAYINAFWAIGNFTSVAGGPGTGGPLGRAGILFASTGYGRYPAPLSNQARDTVGAAVGYQKFLHEFGRRRSCSEIDGRASWSARIRRLRLRRVISRRSAATSLQFDARMELPPMHAGAGAGTRVETRLEF